MIKSYKNRATADIAEEIESKIARRLLPSTFHRKAYVKLAVLAHAVSLQDFSPIGFGLERLKGDRRGQWSIRINKQYRICFVWDGKDAYEVEIIDYH